MGGETKSAAHPAGLGTWLAHQREISIPFGRQKQAASDRKNGRDGWPAIAARIQRVKLSTREAP
jgi:hypothetical protein